MEGVHNMNLLAHYTAKMLIACNKCLLRLLLSVVYILSTVQSICCSLLTCLELDYNKIEENSYNLWNNYSLCPILTVGLKILVTLGIQD